MTKVAISGDLNTLFSNGNIGFPNNFVPSEKTTARQ